MLPSPACSARRAKACYAWSSTPCFLPCAWSCDGESNPGLRLERPSCLTVAPPQDDLAWADGGTHAPLSPFVDRSHRVSMSGYSCWLGTARSNGKDIAAHPSGMTRLRSELLAEPPTFQIGTVPYSLSIPRASGFGSWGRSVLPPGITDLPGQATKRIAEVLTPSPCRPIGIRRRAGTLPGSLSEWSAHTTWLDKTTVSTLKVLLNF